MSLGTVNDADFQAWAERVKGKINSGQIKREIGQSTKRIGVYALNALKQTTPVDTGQLRRSWTADGPNYGGGGWTIRVANNTEYAAYVEYGHRTRGNGWVEGQFFMHNAMNRVSSQLPSLITPGLWAFRDLLE